MRNVEYRWWESETLTTHYVANISVPDDFDSWDEDLQLEYLDEAKCDVEPISAIVTDGEVTYSESEGWSFEG